MTPTFRRNTAEWRPVARLAVALAVLLSAELFPCRVVAAAERRPPNVILMLLDNVGRDWFGCYGSIEQATPEIDLLASAGLRFEHCYATPYCSVSRVELLSGRYPASTGWFIHHDASIYGGGNFDALRLPTFANVLKSAGYATCIVGKWQISDLLDPQQVAALSQAGFGEHCVWPDGPHAHEASAARYWDPYIIENGKRLAAHGRFGPDVFHNYAVDFVRRHRDRPFLLYYPSVLTHGPHVAVPPAPQPKRGPPPKGQQEQLALFAGMVRYADADVARLVRALKDLGVPDNTVLIVTSDNGNTDRLAGRTSPPGPAGGGYTLAEGGIDMPLVVYAPGIITTPGRVSRRLADFTDFFPTLVDLAGAQRPAGLTLDGHSFAASITSGKDDVDERQWMASQYADERVVSDGRYKLYSSGRMYDVSTDPSEKQDVSAFTEPAVVAARQKLERALAELPANAKLPFVPRSQSAYKMRGETPPSKPRPE